MQRRHLGEFNVSILGLGTSRLASLGSATTRAGAARLLDAAADVGVNVIDTADTYGSTDCERLLGDLLKTRRDRFVVVTKGGRVHSDLPGPLRRLNQFAKKARQLAGNTQRFTPDYIAGAIDASLDRLQLDAIDVYLLHSVTEAASRNDELIGVLRDAQRAGKIRAFGFSVDDLALYSAAASAPGCSVVQTMVNPITATAHRERYPSLEQAGITVMANQAFASVMTAPDVVARMDSLAAEQRLSRSSVLLRFAAAQPGVATVLVGTNNPDHLVENAKAFESEVRPEEGEW